MSRRTPRRRKSAPSVSAPPTQEPPPPYVMKSTRLQDALVDAHDLLIDGYPRQVSPSSPHTGTSRGDSRPLGQACQRMAERVVTQTVVSCPSQLPADQEPLASAVVASQVAALELHFQQHQPEDLKSIQQAMQTEIAAATSPSTDPLRRRTTTTSDASAWYVLGKVIGKGAFGRVQLATHRVSHARVAIKSYFRAKHAAVCSPLHATGKVPSPSRLPHESDALTWKRVRQEVRLLTSLQPHAGLIAFIEAFETPTQIQVVMELASGGSLYDLLKKQPHQRLSEPHARRIFAQLCAAVRALHDQHVIHRDLKLENVLLDDQKNARIIDFGFSQREYATETTTEERNCLLSARSVKNFCGTPSYMAPEVVTCTSYDGKRVDIWSLGVLLFVLLCGKFPFQAATLHQLYQTIRATPLVFPATVSKDAQHLVRSMLVADPLQRATLAVIEDHAWMKVSGRVSNQREALVPERVFESFMAWETGWRIICEALARLYRLDVAKVATVARSGSSNRVAALVRLTMLSAQQQLYLALEAASETPAPEPSGTDIIRRKAKAAAPLRMSPRTVARTHKQQLEQLIGLVQQSLA